MAQAYSYQIQGEIMGVFLSVLNINSILNPDAVATKKQTQAVGRKQGIDKCWS